MLCGFGWGLLQLGATIAMVFFGFLKVLFLWSRFDTSSRALFVLFLPVFGLIRALPASKELDGGERLALGIGLSLALVPLAGLLLNYSPWGIRTTPVTLSLLVLTLVFAFAAVAQDYSIRKVG